MAGFSQVILAFPVDLQKTVDNEFSENLSRRLDRKLYCLYKMAAWKYGISLRADSKCTKWFENFLVLVPLANNSTSFQEEYTGFRSLVL